MAYDEKLADRLRRMLNRRKGFSEKKMFGGISFLLDGHMCCGVIKDDLMVRVGPEHYEEALSEPHARPMDFTRRPIKGFIFVGPGGYKTDAALRKWIEQAAHFVLSLPAK